jgi:hypothetical protein
VGERASTGVETGTPALICAECRGETPLVDLTPGPDGARCAHCGARFPGFRSAGRESADADVLAALIDAVEARDRIAALSLLRPDVRWREPELGASAVGADAVYAALTDDVVSRTLGGATAVDDAVVALVLESRVDGPTRVVRWLVEIEAASICSIWVWVVHGVTAPSVDA